MQEEGGGKRRVSRRSEEKDKETMMEEKPGRKYIKARQERRRSGRCVSECVCAEGSPADLVSGGKLHC